MISHEIDVLQVICQGLAMMEKWKIKEKIFINGESKGRIKSFLME